MFRNAIKIFLYLLYAIKQSSQRINPLNIKNQNAFYKKQKIALKISNLYKTDNAKFPYFKFNETSESQKILNSSTPLQKIELDELTNKPIYMDYGSSHHVFVIDDSLKLKILKYESGLIKINSLRDFQLEKKYEDIEFFCSRFTPDFKEFLIFGFSQLNSKILIYKGNYFSKEIEEIEINTSADKLSKSYNSCFNYKYQNNEIGIFVVEEDRENLKNLKEINMRYIYFSFENSKYSLNFTKLVQFSSKGDMSNFILLTKLNYKGLENWMLVYSNGKELTLSQINFKISESQKTTTASFSYTIDSTVPPTGFVEIAKERTLIGYDDVKKKIVKCKFTLIFLMGYQLDCTEENYSFSLEKSEKIKNIYLSRDQKYAFGLISQSSKKKYFIAPLLDKFKTSSIYFGDGVDFVIGSRLNDLILKIKEKSLEVNYLTKETYAFYDLDSEGFQEENIIGIDQDNTKDMKFNLYPKENLIGEEKFFEDTVYNLNFFSKNLDFLTYSFEKFTKGNIIDYEIKAKSDCKYNVKHLKIVETEQEIMTEILSFEEELLIELSKFDKGNNAQYISFSYFPYVDLNIENQNKSILKFKKRSRLVLKNLKFDKIFSLGKLAVDQDYKLGGHLIELNLIDLETGKGNRTLVYLGPGFGGIGLKTEVIRLSKPENEYKFSWTGCVKNLNYYLVCYTDICQLYYVQIFIQELYVGILFEISRFTSGIDEEEFCPEWAYGNEFEDYLYVLSNCNGNRRRLYRTGVDFNKPNIEEIKLSEEIINKKFRIKIIGENKFFYVENSNELYLVRKDEFEFYSEFNLSEFGVEGIQKIEYLNENDIAIYDKKSEEKGGKNSVFIFKNRINYVDVDENYGSQWDILNSLNYIFELKNFDTENCSLLNVSLKHDSNIIIRRDNFFFGCKQQSNNLFKGSLILDIKSPFLKISEQEGLKDEICRFNVTYFFGEKEEDKITREFSTRLIFIDNPLEIKIIEEKKKPKLNKGKLNFTGKFNITGDFKGFWLESIGKNSKKIISSRYFPDFIGKISKIKNEKFSYNYNNQSRDLEVNGLVIRHFNYSLMSTCDRKFNANSTKFRVYFQDRIIDEFQDKEVSLDDSNVDIFHDMVSNKIYVTILSNNGTVIKDMKTLYIQRLKIRVYGGENKNKINNFEMFVEFKWNFDKAVLWGKGENMTIFYSLNNFGNLFFQETNDKFSEFGELKRPIIYQNNQLSYLRNENGITFLTKVQKNGYPLLINYNFETRDLRTKEIDTRDLIIQNLICREYMDKNLRKEYYGVCSITHKDSPSFIYILKLPITNFDDEKRLNLTVEELFNSNEAYTSYWSTMFSDIYDNWLIKLGRIYYDKKNNDILLSVWDLSSGKKDCIYWTKIGLAREMNFNLFDYLAMVRVNEGNNNGDKFRILMGGSYVKNYDFYFEPELKDYSISIDKVRYVGLNLDEIYFSFGMNNGTIKYISLKNVFYFNKFLDFLPEYLIFISGFFVMAGSVIYYRKYQKNLKIKNKIRDKEILEELRKEKNKED